LQRAPHHARPARDILPHKAIRYRALVDLCLPFLHQHPQHSPDEMVSAATMLARAEPPMLARPLVHLVAAVALPVARTCRYGEHLTSRQIDLADTGVPQGDPQWVLDRRVQPHDLLDENRYI